MLMKALQVVRPRTFVQVQVPVPRLRPGTSDRILIRTHWVSMCGSDIPFVTGGKRTNHFPIAPGAPIHECVGQVVESTSALFEPGDGVIAIPEGNQGMAEFFVAQTARAVKLPSDLTSSGTGPLIQPLSTVMNAVDRLGNVQGRSVAVIGLGSTGLFFCWLLNKLGAVRIVGIDPNEYRCQLAERTGKVQTYSLPSSEVVRVARQSPGEWDPPDILIEAVGHQMDTINHCLELVRKGGTVLAFGVPDQPVYAIEYETFFRKNANLIASVTPEWREYLHKARDLFISYREELEAWVTHRFPIRDAAEAFSLYERHEQGIVKAVLDASRWDADVE